MLYKYLVSPNIIYIGGYANFRDFWIFFRFWQISPYLERRFWISRIIFHDKDICRNDQLIIAVILRPISTIFMENHFFPIFPHG